MFLWLKSSKVLQSWGLVLGFLSKTSCVSSSKGIRFAYRRRKVEFRHLNSLLTFLFDGYVKKTPKPRISGPRIKMFTSHNTPGAVHWFPVLRRCRAESGGRVCGDLVTAFQESWPRQWRCILLEIQEQQWGENDLHKGGCLLLSFHFEPMYSLWQDILKEYFKQCKLCK